MPDLKRIKRRTFTKELENEEAPSGYVKLYNYKEPFMKFSGGFGYQGVLMFDGESDKIQCHYCGNWFDYLAPHLKKEHKMKASEYKEAVGLRQTTALISEKLREKLVANGLDKRLQNLRKMKGHKMSKESIAKRTATFKKGLRENQNTKGTCPAQLIARLQNEYQTLGITPVHSASSKKTTRAKYSPEVLESSRRIGSVETYERVFGSWKNALEMANIPYRISGQNIKYHVKWTKEKAIDWLISFIDANSIEPKHKDMPKWMTSKIYKKDFYKKDLLTEAWSKSTNTKGSCGTRYSKDQLLKFLSNFEKIHGRKPSYSDAKRGLIPHLSRYSYHFGSWKKALSVAFPK